MEKDSTPKSVNELLTKGSTFDPEFVCMVSPGENPWIHRLDCTLTLCVKECSQVPRLLMTFGRNKWVAAVLTPAEFPHS